MRVPWPRSTSSTRTATKNSCMGIEIADMSPATFKDIVAVGDTPMVFTDEFIPRAGGSVFVGPFPSSEMPVVSCVVPSLLFDDISLVKSQGPYPQPADFSFAAGKTMNWPILRVELVLRFGRNDSES